MIFTLLAFLVAFGLLITFHELGHYSVARWCGVRVLRFSVGFGPVLFRRIDRQGTEWAVSALPLGGYVKMQDDPPPQATPQQRAESFNLQPVGRRMAIVAAGPIFNLVLAVALYAGLNIAGTEEPAAVLAQPAVNTPAAAAGLNRGDRIVAVDDVEVASWNDARWRLLDRATQGGQSQLTVQTQDGKTVARSLNLPAPQPGADEMDRDPLIDSGLALSVPNPTVRSVVAGSAGERDGLRACDRITRVADVQQPDTRELIEIIQHHGDLPLTLSVLRDGASIQLTAVPQSEQVAGRQIGRLGVQLGGDIERVTVRYGVGESIWRGALRTGETAWFSLKMMGRMLTGEVSWRNISGPITIADYAGQTARIGIAAYVAYLALISISLGVLNLLPIPMLDGGHLLYYLIEIVRGKPLSDRWLAFGQRIGLTMLAMLMGLAFFNDFARQLG